MCVRGSGKGWRDGGRAAEGKSDTRAEGARPSAAAAAAAGGEEPRSHTASDSRPGPAPLRCAPPLSGPQVPPGPAAAGALSAEKGWRAVWEGRKERVWGPCCLSRTLRSPLSRALPGLPRQERSGAGTWRAPGHLPRCQRGDGAGLGAGWALPAMGSGLKGHKELVLGRGRRGCAMGEEFMCSAQHPCSSGLCEGSRA